MRADGASGPVTEAHGARHAVEPLPAHSFVAADWPVPAHVRAVVTTRVGGVSAGARASLNLAAHVGDDRAAVVANRALVRAALALPDEPLWLRQVHGTEVVRHAAPAGEAPNGTAGAGSDVWSGARDASGVAPDDGPEADAAVAFEPGRVLAIMTADCLPVAFATRAGDRVGAAHAGWRGLAGGVLERTVAALDADPADVVAWLGPAIGPAAFEVGAEVRAAFVGDDAAAATAFSANARGRWQADLYALARLRLARAGVRSVHGGGACTYADAQRWFSYRRDREAGRMAMLVWLEPRTPSAPTG